MKKNKTFNMKRLARILASLLLAICLCGAVSCGTDAPDDPAAATDTTGTPTALTSAPDDTEPDATEAPADETTESPAETTAVEKAVMDDSSLIIAKKDTKTDYVFSFHCEKGKMPEVKELSDKLSELTGNYVLLDTTSWDLETRNVPFEFILGETERLGVQDAYEGLGKNDCRMKAYRDDENGQVKILVAFHDYNTGAQAIRYLLDRYLTDDAFFLPDDLDEVFIFRSPSDILIETDIQSLRDPFVILGDDGIYYMYGTGWNCVENRTGSLDGEWTNMHPCVTYPSDAVDNFWAPEVHRYNGAYYMFTTYKSDQYQHRGCSIFRSETPEGPFTEWSDGIVTPKDWDSIDGTFYVDEEGQPWMIFVHEWTSTDDGIGRMAAAKLSDDLKCFVSEPFELFRADDPSWSRAQVTDGCFMYRTTDGDLLMIWSNWDDDGYCVGIARSDNGKLDGNWIQEEKRLYTKSYFGPYDGGHGMIFTDKDGTMYLLLHSPNSQTGTRGSKPVFIPVVEKGGTLMIDFGS